VKISNVAKAYANAVYDLGKSQNVDVVADLTKLQEAINANNNLENVLYLDVFTDEEKKAVINDVLTKLGVHKLVKNLIQYLTNEKRMNIFPSVYKELIVRDDHEKGFLKGSIEGNEASLSPETKKMLEDFVQKVLNKKVLLKYEMRSDVAAGYKITVEDLQLDATIENQLKRFEETVLN
jgi:F-type H+-transporting ATPase subunit delta